MREEKQQKAKRTTECHREREKGRKRVKKIERERGHKTRHGRPRKALMCALCRLVVLRWSCALHCANDKAAGPLGEEGESRGEKRRGKFNGKTLQGKGPNERWEWLDVEGRSVCMCGR